jgi:hypothetical protein
MLTQGAHAIRHDPLMKDAAAFCGMAGTSVRERVRKRVPIADTAQATIARPGATGGPAIGIPARA